MSTRNNLKQMVLDNGGATLRAESLDGLVRVEATLPIAEDGRKEAEVLLQIYCQILSATAISKDTAGVVLTGIYNLYKAVRRSANVAAIDFVLKILSDVPTNKEALEIFQKAIGG